MEASGRCSSGSRDFRIDGLIIVVIGDLLFDLGWKRHLAKAFQDLKEDTRVVEFHVTDAFRQFFDAGAAKRAVSKSYRTSRMDGLGVAHKAFPRIGFLKLLQ